MLPKVMYVYCVVLLLVESVCSQFLESPCPRLFVYEPRNETDKWYGIVTLISDSELSGIWLRINLDRPSQQLGNWFGEVVTEDHQSYLVKNRNHKLSVNTPYPLRFYIKYDPNGPVPQLASIRLNAKTVCPENGVTTEPPTTSGQLITSSIFSTTPVPGGVAPAPPSRPLGDQRPAQQGGGGFQGQGAGFQGQGGGFQGQGGFQRPSDFGNGGIRPTFGGQGSDSDDDFFPNDFNFRPDFLEVDNSECGTVATRFKRQVYYYDVYDNQRQQPQTYANPNQYGNFYQYLNSIINSLQSNRRGQPQQEQEQQQKVEAQPLILYGEKTQIGQFPWHAALYHSRGVGLHYVCGGSLISRNHVVTAGHCVTGYRSQQVLNPENLLIYLGKYYLKKWSSPGVQNHQVVKIIRHPNYSGRMYQNDIAVLKLASAADFTDYVRPVCLWEGNNDINALVGQQGTVVGWGYNEHGKLTEELIKLNMPIIAKETCIYSFPEFYVKYTTSETFCAGFTNGSTVCNGDSGGGLILPKNTGNPNRKAYQLRGIVSLSVALQNEFKCDPKHYVVFTDVAKYINFIKSAMAE